jgi:hypothetical protein
LDPEEGVPLLTDHVFLRPAIEAISAEEVPRGFAGGCVARSDVGAEEPAQHVVTHAVICILVSEFGQPA